jgi:hypothetical protein
MSPASQALSTIDEESKAQYSEVHVDESLHGSSKFPDSMREGQATAILDDSEAPDQ